MQATSCPALFAGSLMPDGSGIYVATNGDPTQLTDGQFDLRPSWSPDGSRIAFAGDLSGRAGRPSMNLYKVDVNGGELERLTEDPGVGVLQWSPRGGMIAFTRSLRSQFTDAVFVIGEDGTGERMLEEGARLVSWLANGEAVLVDSGRELWTIDVSSGARNERRNQPESFLRELPCQNGLHEIIGR